MFLVLVSPAELLQFYADLVHRGTLPAYELAIIMTNLLQVSNENDPLYRKGTYDLRMFCTAEDAYIKFVAGKYAGDDLDNIIN